MYPYINFIFSLLIYKLFFAYLQQIILLGIHILGCYTSLSRSSSFSNLLLLKTNMFTHCPQRQLLYSGYCKFAQVVFPTGMIPQLFFVLQIVQKLLFKFHLFWPVCAIPELFLLWILKQVLSLCHFPTVNHGSFWYYLVTSSGIVTWFFVVCTYVLSMWNHHESNNSQFFIEPNRE